MLHARRTHDMADKRFVFANDLSRRIDAGSNCNLRILTIAVEPGDAYAAELMLLLYCSYCSYTYRSRDRET